MTEMKASILLSLKNSRFIQGLNQTQERFNRFGKRIRGFGEGTGRDIGVLANKVSGLTVLFGALGVAAAGKKVVDFDTRLARLAIQAGLSRKRMFELKNELFQIGRQTYTPPEALLSGIEQIVEKTGNFEFAVGAIRDMGFVASATGSAVADIGSSASDLQEKFGVTKDQVLSVFDILAEQGKKGSFTLQNMAAYFPELLSAAAGFGVHGVEGLRKFGAFLQIARRGAGTSAEASTAVERSFADMVAKWQVIRRLTGFSIFDKEKSKKEGRAVVKELDVVLKEVIKRTNGDITKLQKIFGEESIRAIRPLAQSYQRFGDFREFDAFVNMGGTGETVMKDFAFWTEQTAANLTELNIEVSKFANGNLAAPIRLFTSALEILNNHPALTKGVLYGLTGLLGLGAGAWAFKGVRGAAMGAQGLWGSIGRLLGGAGGKAAGAARPVPFVEQSILGPYGAGGRMGASGVMPVYVTNEGGLMPGGVRTDIRRLSSSLTGKLLLGGTVVLSAYAGLQLGKQINNALSRYIDEKTGGRDKDVGEFFESTKQGFKERRMRYLAGEEKPRWWEFHVKNDPTRTLSAAVHTSPGVAGAILPFLPFGADAAKERENSFLNAIASFHAAEARGWGNAGGQANSEAPKVENQVNIDLKITPDRVTSITNPGTKINVQRRGSF